ncbi:MAG: hypothetical protein ACP5IJ_00795 [Candidatus Nanoarchaeia archaeon]
MEFKLDKIATGLFLIGVLLAIVFGFFAPEQIYLAVLLALIGIVVGAINITSTEAEKFLIATVALIVAANSFALVPIIGSVLLNVLRYLIAMVAPAAVIVALIVIWKLAKTK